MLDVPNRNTDALSPSEDLVYCGFIYGKGIGADSSVGVVHLFDICISLFCMFEFHLSSGIFVHHESSDAWMKLIVYVFPHISKCSIHCFDSVLSFPGAPP